jgi:hypothetical protein
MREIQRGQPEHVIRWPRGDMEITYYQRPIDVDMHQCMMMEGVEITIGAGSGVYITRDESRVVRTGATAIFGECIQAMQDEERLMDDQDNSDSEQKDILSNSEQEDLFNVDEDDPIMEGNDRDIERAVIDVDRLAWINIPTRVARDLLHVGNGGQDMGTMVEATRSIALDIEINNNKENQQMLIAAQPRDMHAVDRMQRIIAGLICNLRRRVDTTIYYEQQEVVRMQATERDLGVHILSYMHDEDMLSVACTNKYLGDKVQEAHNTKERYICSSAQRVQRCVNVLQSQAGEL